MCSEADADISQAFSLTELTKYHREELLPPGENLYAMISIEFFNAFIEFVLGEKADDLVKNVLTFIHFEQVRNRSLTIAKSN